VQDLQQVVQSGKCLDEEVCTFVWKLISSGSKEIENFIKIKVVVAEISKQTQNNVRAYTQYSKGLQLHLHSWGFFCRYEVVRDHVTYSPDAAKATAVKSNK